MAAFLMWILSVEMQRFRQGSVKFEAKCGCRCQEIPTIESDKGMRAMKELSILVSSQPCIAPESARSVYRTDPTTEAGENYSFWKLREPLTATQKGVL
jgi:hypothetical protein